MTLGSAHSLINQRKNELEIDDLLSMYVSFFPEFFLTAIKCHLHIKLLSYVLKIDFRAKQAAAGMQYLGSKGIVHCDLALR